MTDQGISASTPIEMAGDENWFVVAVAPRAEDAVARRAGEISVTAYYPTGKQMVRRGRVRVIEFGVLRPAMPGYVFVQGDRHFSKFRRDYDAPDAVPKCLGWLCGPEGPEPVHPDVIGALKQREADGEFDALTKDRRYWAPRWMRPGARIRIVAGPFKGVIGQIWRMTKSRKVAMWLSIMGRLTLAECAIDDVARVR